MGYGRLLKIIIAVLLVYHLSAVWLAATIPSSELLVWILGAGLVGYILLLTVVRRGFRDQKKQLHQQKQQLKELEQKLTTWRNVDELTQLANRAQLYQQLDFQLARAQLQQQSLAVLLLNCDQLNTINSEFGHLTGDAVLKEVATVVKGQLRGQDIFGRWGGDEFLIMISPTHADKVVEIAEKVRLAVAQQRFTEDKLYVTVSIGCAIFNDQDTVISLIQRANNGVEQAKHSGRNCTRVGD